MFRFYKFMGTNISGDFSRYGDFVSDTIVLHVPFVYLHDIFAKLS